MILVSFLHLFFISAGMDQKRAYYLVMLIQTMNLMIIIENIF